MKYSKRFSDCWSKANAQAERDFPKPIPNGFYQVDKLAADRKVRQWKIIIKSKVMLPEDKETFLDNFMHETFGSRDMIVAIANSTGLKTKRVATKKIIEQIWSLSCVK